MRNESIELGFGDLQDARTFKTCALEDGVRRALTVAQYCVQEVQRRDFRVALTGGAGLRVRKRLLGESCESIESHAL